MASQSRRRTRSFTIETEEDILRGVRSLRRRCEVMRRVHDQTGMPPLRRRAPGFEGLARIVVGQQVSVASADAIWARCAAAIDPMTVAQCEALSDDELRGCGLSRPKVRTLRAICHAVTHGGLDLEGAQHIAADTFRADLLKVSGIGPWTADVFQLFCLGQGDAFAAGDLALQVAAEHAFSLDARPSADELSVLAEAWRPWRGVAARLLWSYYRVVREGRSGISV